MGNRPRHPQELRERAVRLVQEHRDEYPSEWAAITSVAGKLGIGTEALRPWLRRAQREPQPGPGGMTAEQQWIRELEREVRELRRANVGAARSSAWMPVISSALTTWPPSAWSACARAYSEHSISTCRAKAAGSAGPGVSQ